MDSISKWCNINNMALHPKNTKCMVIGSKQKVSGDKFLQLTLRPNENVICHKVLGAIIDYNLNWHKHIDYVCKALNNKMHYLHIFCITLQMK